ncbi:hypothetical protein BJX68DRAFT_25384 [Aspergillus pseudodeflectus]|uniref:Uncharacterized protein n=1 Tax=Aspergillus pseudodeflectus TaxID=176178 RepID=A0ABR4JAT5_9EURO
MVQNLSPRNRLLPALKVQGLSLPNMKIERLPSTIQVSIKQTFIARESAWFENAANRCEHGKTGFLSATNIGLIFGTSQTQQNLITKWRMSEGDRGRTQEDLDINSFRPCWLSAPCRPSSLKPRNILFEVPRPCKEKSSSQEGPVNSRGSSFQWNRLLLAASLYG